MTKLETADERAERQQEARVRQRAKRQGFSVCRSRQQFHFNNHGLYQLVESSRNYVVLGSNFDASLDEIEEYLKGE